MSKRKTITEFKRGSILYVRIPKTLLHWMDGEIGRLKFRSRSVYITALLALAQESRAKRERKKK